MTRKILLKVLLMFTEMHVGWFFHEIGSFAFILICYAQCGWSNSLLLLLSYDLLNPKKTPIVVRTSIKILDRTRCKDLHNHFHVAY